MGAFRMLASMSDPSEEQRAWLRTVLQQTKLAPTALAQRAGVAQPTITRFLNDPNAKHALSARTVAAVEKATGMRYGPDPRPTGLRESWEPPYLAPATYDAKLREIFPVDNRNTAIKGVVIATVRPRQARAA